MELKHASRYLLEFHARITKEIVGKFYFLEQTVKWAVIAYFRLGRNGLDHDIIEGDI